LLARELLFVALHVSVFTVLASVVLGVRLGLPLAELEPWLFVEALLRQGASRSIGEAALVSAGCTALLAILTRFSQRFAPIFGDARFATPGEARHARLLEASGVLLGRTRKHGPVLRNGEPLHVLVAAPPRSGKGVGFVIPNLLSWPGSALVLDVKHENHQRTSGFRAHHGQAVYLWSPGDRHGRSHRYNPLDAVRREPIHRVSDLQRLASILIPDAHAGDSMWESEARDLFVGVALFVLDTPDVPHTIGQIYRTVKSEHDLAEEIVEVLAARGGTLDDACRRSLANWSHKAVKERSGVKSNLTAALTLWSNPAIDAATSSSDFQLEDLRRRPMTVYVGVATDNVRTLSRLLALFFEQATGILARELPGPDEKHQVLFLIDEFPTLGRLDVLASSLAYLAGYGVRICAIVQGLSQLDQIYGRAGRESLLQNSAVQWFAAPNDETTANYLSARLGKRTIRTVSRTRPHGFGTGSRSESYAQRDLLLPDEVRRLDPRQVLVFKEGARPVRARKIRYYEERDFRDRMLPTAAVPSLHGAIAAPVVPTPQPPPESPASSRRTVAAQLRELLEDPQSTAGVPQ
jgi:type IV secretion system protein VirD4